MLVWPGFPRKTESPVMRPPSLWVLLLRPWTVTLPLRWLTGSVPAFLPYLLAAPEPAGMCENIRIYPCCLICLFLSRAPQGYLDSPVAHRLPCPCSCRGPSSLPRWLRVCPPHPPSPPPGPQPPASSSASPHACSRQEESVQEAQRAAGRRRFASQLSDVADRLVKPLASGTSCVCPVHTCVSVCVRGCSWQLSGLLWSGLCQKGQ